MGARDAMQKGDASPLDYLMEGGALFNRPRLSFSPRPGKGGHEHQEERAPTAAESDSDESHAQRESPSRSPPAANPIVIVVS